MRRAWWLGLLGLALVAGWWRPRATLATAPLARTPLVLLATSGARTEALAWDGERLRPLGAIEHAPEAGPRGALLPDGRVLVVVDRAGALGPTTGTPVDRQGDADGSYGSVLALLEPGGVARVLADGVALASRPLVTPAGRIYVSRGHAGVAVEGARRDDALALDVLDGVDLGPTTGTPVGPRTVLAAVGWELHAAAVSGEQAVVYVKSATGGALWIVDEAARARQLATLERWARDFSVAGDALYYSDRAPERAGLWQLLRLELAGGAPRVLLTSPSQHLAPLALPGGDVAYSAAAAAGAELPDDGLATLARGLVRPAGAGVDVARAVSADGRWLACAHFAPGAIEAEIVVAPGDGRGVTLRLTPPARTRYEIVGFAGSAP